MNSANRSVPRIALDTEPWMGNKRKEPSPGRG